MFTNLKDEKEKAAFEKKWISIMSNLGKYNKMKNTFSLNNVEKTNYGYKALILIVDGLRYSELEECRDAIEDAYGCMCIFNKDRRTNLINADFVFNEPSNMKFEALEGLKPWEVYLGNDYSGKPIILDLVKFPHILISGGTRSGKSKMTDCIITTLIINCNEDELELYLVQVAKSDLILYEDAIQCRGFADNLSKALKLLKHIDNKMSDRDKLIRPYRKKAKADNYIDYNAINKSQPLSTTYVIFDETASLFNSTGDNEEVKKLKAEIVSYMKKIAQYGAGLGVFMLCSLQRPDIKNLDSFIKSQSTCNISFRQNNQKSSEVATGESDIAVGLKQREFVYATLNFKYGVVPLINNKKIFDLIKPYLKPNHRNVFQDIRKINEIKGNDKEKVKNEVINPPLVFDQVNKGEITVNTNMPGYVPYEDKSKLIVIEEPRIISNTSKPQRGGREKI